MFQSLESIELRIFVDELGVEHQGQRRDPGIGYGQPPCALTTAAFLPHSGLDSILSTRQA
jgi:hypothetical protein